MKEQLHIRLDAKRKCICISLLFKINSVIYNRETSISSRGTTSVPADLNIFQIQYTTYKPLPECMHRFIDMKRTQRKSVFLICRSQTLKKLEIKLKMPNINQVNPFKA
jgi:hypothetical protein